MSVCERREIFENQQEITTATVIWARQLVSPRGMGEEDRVPICTSRILEGRSQGNGLRERFLAIPNNSNTHTSCCVRVDEFDAVGRPCEEASEMAIAVLHGALKVGLADSPEVDTLDDP